MYSLSILCQGVLSGSHLLNGMATGHPPVRSKISWIGLMPLFSIASVERFKQKFGQNFAFWKEYILAFIIIPRKSTTQIDYILQEYCFFNLFFFRILAARELTFKFNSITFIQLKSRIIYLLKFLSILEKMEIDGIYTV